MRTPFWLLCAILVGSFCWGSGSGDEVLEQKATGTMSLPAPNLLSPDNGAEVTMYPAVVNLQWSEVPGASSYAIELDCKGCCAEGAWCSLPGHPGDIVPDLEVPGFTFLFWGDQPRRWRVWAVGSLGDGAVSEWREVIHRAPKGKALAASRPAPRQDCSWAVPLSRVAPTMPALLTSASEPEYEETASKKKINAVVTVEIKVGVSGYVEKTCISNSPRPDLDKAALRAIRAWRFSPATLDGVAVAELKTVTVRFRACCDTAVILYPPMGRKLLDDAAAALDRLIAKSPCGPLVAPADPGTQPPKAIYNPDPPYSQEGQASRLNGNVILLVKVGANGLVENVCVAKPLRRDMDESAVRTVKTWRFDPALRDGVAVAYTRPITIEFRLF